MKKITIHFLFVTIFTFVAFGQDTSKVSLAKLIANSDFKSELKYSFSIHTSPYYHLTGATSLNNGEVWDDPIYEFAVPFPFKVNNNEILLFEVRGLGGTISCETSTEGVYELLLPFYTDLIDRGYETGVSLSPISYIVEGAPGNRLMKIEWRNVGSYNEGDPYSMYISFQLWIFEATQIIEVRFGPNMINNPTDFYENGIGAHVGIYTYNILTDEILNSASLTGAASNPSLTNQIIDDTISIEGTPVSGTIYRFTPVISNVNSYPNFCDFKIYPNPATDFVNLHFSGTTIPENHILIVTNELGQELFSSPVHNKLITLHVSALNQKGICFFHILDSERETVITKKVLLQ